MAVIRIDPIWIATSEQSGEYPNYVWDFDYDYPLISDRTGPFSGKSINFRIDAEELLRLRNLASVTGIKFVFEISPTSDFDGTDVVLLINNDLPTAENPPMGGNTGAHVDSEIENNILKLDVNTYFQTPGPTKPELHHFWTIIEQGKESFVLLPHPSNARYAYVKANDFYVELEGNFDNNRPTATRPVGGQTENTSSAITFRWNHNSPLKQTAFELRYRKVGTSSWTYINNQTSNTQYSLPSNTLDSADYEWQVRTTSEFDFVSPWSLIQVFNAAHTSPAPEITKPSVNEVIGVADLEVEWNSVSQHQYEIQLLRGSTLIWQESKTSASKKTSKKDILENNTSYKIRLRINQQDGIFSPWTERNFSVSYTPPAKPILHIEPDTENASLVINIENPFSTGTQPNAVRQELFKRKRGDTWIKIANLLPNDTYIDYAVASGVQYEYRSIVQGDNDTSRTSNTFRGSVKLQKDIINLTTDFSIFIELQKDPGRSFSFDFNAQQKQFSGRSKPVAEFGEVVSYDATINYLVFEDELESIKEIAFKQKTILYRDVRGRKIYGVISSLSIDDVIRHRDMFNIQLSVLEVDYIEGID